MMLISKAKITMDTKNFTLGVNYWPQRKAMYWWSDFEAGEVKEEFEIIKDIGMDLVQPILQLASNDILQQ